MSTDQVRLAVDCKAKTRNACRMSRLLDQTDWRIIAELQRDGRLSYNQLGRLVNMSSPAVAERVRRLEEAGVIGGYQARIDPARAGLPLTAFVQLRCALGRCLLKTTGADDFPEVVEVHKLSGNSCTMLKVRVASMPHLEGLLERLGEHGEMNSHIVLSTQYDGRPVQPPPAEARTTTHSPGWVR
ncbi:Lrp/AsnC family transcriptional regulator [Micromonospora globispora]|uniref:Lrp/AsnC family transcriptional regulator n=1 Tax=Micromonospora globispora TaxID=1450148 RepID=UPI001FB019B2|nr:Lrp/AsnC family transcriptional regulator [Micromonospora globispora]